MSGAARRLRGSAAAPRVIASRAAAKQSGGWATRSPRALRALAMTMVMTGTLGSAAAAQTIAITGGRVYPVSGPMIENGTVLIRDGRIVAVGADVSVPADARRIDAAGKWVTPGLVHGGSDLGLALMATGGARETMEAARTGDVNAAFNVAEGIDPASITFAPALGEGVTTALAAPNDGLVAGQAVVIDLAGETVPDLLVRSPAAMVASLSERSKNAGGGSRAGAVQRLRDLLRDAREYRTRRADYRTNRMQQLSAPEEDLEALQPLLAGEIPLYVVANRRSDIENALRIAAEFDLRLAIWGGAEAWKAAPALAERGVPVLVNAYVDRPDFDAPGATLENAARLSAAGVPVMLADDGPSYERNTHFRTLRFAAGEAVRNGMAWDSALAAVTLTPARTFGIGSRYGSLEVGKVANVVVWSGDPFEFSSRAETILVRGAEITPVPRQKQLLERYRTLPPEY